MLYYHSIDTKTLELLKEIRNIDLFKDLRLVGGTALALQIGHRKSVDLDFFGILNSDELAISESLKKIGTVKTLQKTENIFIFTIDGIKVDIVNYNYPWLSGIVKEDRLDLADKKDISAMKLAAITGRGTKNDFIDIYFLLKEFSLHQMIEFYKQKYSDGSVFLVLRSLSYFEDADNEPMPEMFVKTDWESVRKSISKALKNYINATRNDKINPEDG